MRRLSACCCALVLERWRLGSALPRRQGQIEGRVACRKHDNSSRASSRGVLWTNAGFSAGIWGSGCILWTQNSGVRRERRSCARKSDGTHLGTALMRQIRPGKSCFFRLIAQKLIAPEPTSEFPRRNRGLRGPSRYTYLEARAKLRRRRALRDLQTVGPRSIQAAAGVIDARSAARCRLCCVAAAQSTGRVARENTLARGGRNPAPAQVFRDTTRRRTIV